MAKPLDFQTLSLWGLFTSSFLSSTLLPGSSEAVLIYIVQQQSHAPWILLSIATLGNTLGGLTSYGLGWLVRKRYRPEDMISEKRQQALQRIKRYGTPVLLLSWVPIIGDPLCFAAGWLRLNVVYATIAILIGKAVRYYALILIAA